MKWMRTTDGEPGGDGTSMDPNQGGGGGDGAVDIAALLEDEAAADTPIRVADLKPFLEQHSSKLIADAEATFTRRQQEQQAAERARSDQQAAAQEDIDFAASIYKRMADPATRAEAEAEMQANGDRYARGRSLQFQRESSEAQSKAVNAYMEPIWAAVKPEYESLFTEVFTENSEALRAAGGNWMLAAMKHAENLGYQRGKNEAADEADQTRRINEGADGPHANNGAGGGGARGSLEERAKQGVDFTKPGAAALYQANLQRERERDRVAARR